METRCSAVKLHFSVAGVCRAVLRFVNIQILVRKNAKFISTTPEEI